MSFGHPVIARIAGKIRCVFESLDSQSYLGPSELVDFRFFRALFEESLRRIDRKAVSGKLRPLDLQGFPQDLRYPGHAARIGIFIGSFDPFQMSHLAMALRFLASDASEADAVFVVPEGRLDLRKPRKTEYRFRFEILRAQLEGILEPLIMPLDIGEGADTIEIVNRLIALHPGVHLRLTHLLGSDVLPIAARFLPDDLEAWHEAAARNRVALDFSIHAVRREIRAPIKRFVDAARSLGVRMVIDKRIIGTPSSSAFRSDGAITIIFPTEAVMSRLELLFRYGMNRPWISGQGGARPSAPDYSI